jgi:hypothetical protein
MMECDRYEILVQIGLPEGDVLAPSQMVDHRVVTLAVCALVLRDWAVPPGRPGWCKGIACHRWLAEFQQTFTTSDETQNLRQL